MSFPTRGDVQVTVPISATEAANLAFEINNWLSRAKDAQEASPDFFLQTSSFDTKWLLAQLSRIRIRENIYLFICPDQPTPETSGYFNYSAPLQYVE